MQEGGASATARRRLMKNDALRRKHRTNTLSPHNTYLPSHMQTHRMCVCGAQTSRRSSRLIRRALPPPRLQPQPQRQSTTA